MESEGSMNLDERLKLLMSHLQSESVILERLVYKHKNQHRRCPYFHAILKVRRDLKLLLSAGLVDILNAVFPIIDGKKPAQLAFLSQRGKRSNNSRKHNYHDRLLGVARLLSQMAEPILKAAIQISFLLAKSFFTGFSLASIALLARLRVLVQQILLHVVTVFNKISSLSQQKQSVIITPGGVEAVREYYPSHGDVCTLECVWKTDKFVLLERIHNNSIEKQHEDQGVCSTEAAIQYEPIELLSEALFTESEPNLERPLLPVVVTSSEGQSFTAVGSTDAVDCERVSIEEPYLEGKLFINGGSVLNLNLLGTQTVSRDKVAFVAVRNSDCFETDLQRASKKMKLEMLSSSAAKAGDTL